MAITLVLALPAGYALARLSGAWGQSVGVGIFLVYLVPPTLLFLPLSRLIAEAHLQNTLWSLILVYPSFTIPFATWLLMGFFKTIPQELEDAALVDGCSRLRALAQDRLPDLPAGDPDGRDLRVRALRERVHLRVHVHVVDVGAHALGGRSERADPRRRLLLAIADGRGSDSEYPARAALQLVPRSFHQGIHGWCVPVGRYTKGGGRWRKHARSPSGAARV